MARSPRPDGFNTTTHDPPPVKARDLLDRAARRVSFTLDTETAGGLLVFFGLDALPDDSARRARFNAECRRILTDIGQSFLYERRRQERAETRAGVVTKLSHKVRELNKPRRIPRRSTKHETVSERPDDGHSRA